MRLLTGEEIRQADAIAIMEYGIPGVVLMENAGRALAFAADAMLAASGGHKVTVITGGGNNGGDGFVAARHLHNMGHTVRLFLLVPPEKLRSDALLNWQIIEKMGMEAQVLTEAASVKVLAVPRWAMEPSSTVPSRKSMAEHIILAACSRVRRASVSARRCPFTRAPSVMP